jgi:CRP/FNR family cyclic AMP-dependent transcriptional regulator
VAGSRVFLHDLLVDVKRLQGIAIFSGLSKRELERLSQWTDEISVPAGHELAREGQFAHEFFVIESGNADVLKDGTRIAELGPGDFFGEIGLLETERRTASVVAATEMELIVMFQREFKAMEKEMPSIADRVRAAIRARLAN